MRPTFVLLVVLYESSTNLIDLFGAAVGELVRITHLDHTQLVLSYGKFSLFFTCPCLYSRVGSSSRFETDWFGRTSLSGH